MRRALITGITGQDGSYLAELLLSKGYDVHGIVRRSSTFNTSRVAHLYRDPHDAESSFHLHYGDLTDGTTLRRILEVTRPHEIYNLGAQSHVGLSFELAEYTADVDATGALRLFEAIRASADDLKSARIYQAGTSEMFGESPPPQSEMTRFLPRSPYAVAKLAAHHFAQNYRAAHGLFIANGILFNHESPRRGETFLSRKVTRAVGRIKCGLQDKLYLGNLDARRDWGFAGDYVEAMWRMLQQPTPDDFVIGTGESYSVREFLGRAFGYAGLDWQEHVEIDPRYFRPTEVDALRCDATRARNELGWAPRVRFDELVRMMVDHDMHLAEKERAMRKSGYSFPPGAS